MRWMAIDGGGTSAKIRIEDASGLVFESQGGPCNWFTTPREQWIQTIREAVRGETADAVYGCFAGALPADEAVCAAALAQAIGLAPERCRAESDCAAALAAFPEGTLVGVIAGTGSSIFSRVDGRLVRSGGGGPFLGDAGSAVDIMRRWINANVVVAGPTGNSATHEKLAELAGGVDRDAVLRWLYQTPNPAAALAPLFPTLAANNSQDPAIQSSLGDLATQVAAHLSHYHPGQTNPTVGLAGGVWEAHPDLRIAFSHHLISATIVEPSMTPVEGAMRLAKATFS
ncbi:MAG: hypothetical protein JNJ45_12205 [Chthonomonas sp.]|nr:hypothetical protein [Chthonomonas sp.]